MVPALTLSLLPLLLLILLYFNPLATLIWLVPLAPLLLFLPSLMRHRPAARDEISARFDKEFWEILGGKEYLTLVMGARGFKSYYDQYNYALKDNLFYYLEFTYKPSGRLSRKKIIFRVWGSKGDWEGGRFNFMYLSQVSVGGNHIEPEFSPSPGSTLLRNVDGRDMCDLIKSITGLSVDLWGEY